MLFHNDYFFAQLLFRPYKTTLQTCISNDTSITSVCHRTTIKIVSQTPYFNSKKSWSKDRETKNITECVDKLPYRNNLKIYQHLILRRI